LSVSLFFEEVSAVFNPFCAAMGLPASRNGLNIVLVWGE